MAHHFSLASRHSSVCVSPWLSSTDEPLKFDQVCAENSTMAPTTSATGPEGNRYCSNTDNIFLVIFGILIWLITVLLLGATVEAYREHRCDSVLNVLFQIVEKEDVQMRDDILNDLCAKNCGIYQGRDGVVCLQWMNKLAGVERVAERARKLVAEELADKIQS